MIVIDLEIPLSLNCSYENEFMIPSGEASNSNNEDNVIGRGCILHSMYSDLQTINPKGREVDNNKILI